METFKYKIIPLLLLAMTSVLPAQTKQEKTFKTNSDVTVEFETSHTNVVVEHWNRNEVKVEAYLDESDLAKEESQRLLESWNLETRGNASKVFIQSGGGRGMGPGMNLPDMPPMANLPEIMTPLMEMVNPLMEKMAQHPLPPQAFESLGELNFDYEAYKEQGDAYLEKWEQQIEENFGEDFEKAMEDWAANFERDTLLNEKFEKSMEEWGEQFGASMEQWGEEFGKNMEAWAENFEKQMDSQNELIVIQNGKHIFGPNPSSTKAKRTIKVQIPKNANLILEVRHGNVRIEGEANNLQGEISHGQFRAQTISGKETRMSASYTPIEVSQWNYGVLNTAYVPSCKIEKVRSLKLTSNSSELVVGEIEDNAIIAGTFGKLEVQKLSPGFSTVDFTLDNSELRLNLPNTALDFNYNGSQSNIDYPGSIKAEKVEQYDTEILNGHYKSKNGKGTINIKAKFSNIEVTE